MQFDKIIQWPSTGAAEVIGPLSKEETPSDRFDLSLVKMIAENEISADDSMIHSQKIAVE